MTDNTQAQLEKILEAHKTWARHNLVCKKNDCYQVAPDDPHFGMSGDQAVEALTKYTEKREIEARIDENKLWLKKTKQFGATPIVSDFKLRNRWLKRRVGR